jgi:hypothetical protein
MPSRSIETRLPGARWFHQVPSGVMRIGVLTGVYFSMVMVAAVLLANRAPWLEDFANVRNWVARIAFALALWVPIVVYRGTPRRLFLTGMLAWTLATITYVLLGLFFPNLYTRLRTPGEFFMFGAMVYGIAAIICWLADLVLAAREHHLQHQHSVVTSRRHIL